MSKIAIIYGKKSEEIRLLPIINELHNQKISIIPVQTGEQELQMKEDFVYSNQILAKNTTEQQSAIMQRLNHVLDAEDLIAVLVIGNTLSAFCGALYGYLRNVKILHINAGQRTYNLHNAFPEEGFGQMIDKLANLYFVTTKFNYKNLINEKINKKKIHIVGNTLFDIINETKLVKKEDVDEILIAIHRNENTKNIKCICMAINNLVKTHQDHVFNVLLPTNINMSNEMLQYLLINTNINILKDLNHIETLNYINRSKLIITDGFGIQEEALILKKPTLILREYVENIESFKAGTTKMIEIEYMKILSNVEAFLNNKLKFRLKDCKYYKKEAAKNIVDIINNTIFIKN